MAGEYVSETVASSATRTPGMEGGTGVTATRSTAVDHVTRRVHHHFLTLDRSVQPDDTAAIRERTHIEGPLLEQTDIDAVVQGVRRLLFGLGSLEVLLGDPTVTELMINGPGHVWVERAGIVQRSDVMIDAPELQMVIERVLGPLGLRIDRTAPFVDARLADGSRVNVAAPPLAIDGPYVTIRRFRVQPFALAAFCAEPVAELLRQAVLDRQSMIVSGGTGSGKTSLLNALAAHIDVNERVITIEDAAELRLPGDHTVRLEARPANAEGVGEVTIRSLVRNALRMRPDRLIIGEVRGAEALDMLQAMHTGHEGSLSTCHANSPIDALRRVEAMALMSDVDLPLELVREQLESAVDLIVHVGRTNHGRRRVESVYRCGKHAAWLVQDGQAR